MGKNWRGPRHPQADDLVSEERIHPSSRAHEHHPRSQASRGPRNNFRSSDHSSERAEYPQNTTHTNSLRHSTSNPVQMQSPLTFDADFIFRSKQLLNQLGLFLNAALVQIEHWHPDMMDWQPEEEIRIPPQATSTPWVAPTQAQGQFGHENPGNNISGQVPAFEVLQPAGAGTDGRWTEYRGSSSNESFQIGSNWIPDIRSPSGMDSGTI
ncbi:MAG: hypothetical protein CL912_02005 [Deltaproteobacteria bacterium]|nr:hypothetical protein [Deltaproteobacteria bacterium]